ncbi:MAG: peptidylprolyl isomerase [Sulfuricellaceae bacterium]|nr:peptidylprolyl isomerase [Sulfuricellaceae bacterium]
MMSLKSRVMMAGIAGLLTLSACNAEESTKSVSDKAVVTVNGTPISETQVDALIKSQGQKDTPELRKAVRNDLVSRALIAQEANKKGMDKDVDVKAQMDLATQLVLVRAYLQDYVKSHPISDSAIKAEYDKIKAQMGDKEYKVRHILVDSEAAANDIEAQLKKGAKFDKLASEKSKDPGSKDKGGDLGWIARGNVVPAFGDALAKLKKGETSAPVHSPFGWHVIKLEDTRPLKAPAFDAIKDGLMKRLEQQEVQKAVEELRAKAKIEDTSAK